jgi:hypothetical protein
MDLTDIGYEGVDWIQVAQDRVHCQAFMDMVLNVFNKSREFNEHGTDCIQ